MITVSTRIITHRDRKREIYPECETKTTSIKQITAWLEVCSTSPSDTLLSDSCKALYNNDIAP